MIKRALFVLLAVVSTLTGIYPVIYFFIDQRFGLLNTKTDALLADNLWNITFYIHIVSGGIPLLIGWSQFVVKWRIKYTNVHRNIGKVYVASVIVSGLTSIYIALFATGGLIPSVGFICMGLVWLFTTFTAYTHIKNGQITSHHKMMIYSYATCLAAVTLRIYLPLFIYLFEDFNKAYSVVAWLSWVPNLIVAYMIIQHIHSSSHTAAELVLPKAGMAELKSPNV